jgi:hypothetical protein
MKGSRSSEEQIIGILREHEAGASTVPGRRAPLTISNPNSRFKTLRSRFSGES